MIDFDDLDGAEEARDEEEAPLRAAQERETVEAEEAEHWTARISQSVGSSDQSVPLFAEPDSSAIIVGSRSAGDTLRLVHRSGDFALLHPLELIRVAKDYQDYWLAILKNEVPRRHGNAWIQVSCLEPVLAERGTSTAQHEVAQVDTVDFSPSQFSGDQTEALKSISEAVTIIVSTSPAQHHCNAEVLLQVLRSLNANTAFWHCRKLIVFDAAPSEEDQKLAREKGMLSEGGEHWVPQVSPELAQNYKQYQEKLKLALKMGNKALHGAELLFMPKWGHLVGTVEFALQHIRTPYVVLHQHDLILAESFTSSHVLGILRALASKKANYVILNRDVNFTSRSTQYFQAAPHRLDSWRVFVRKHSLQLDDEETTQLTPFIGFSDQTHFARKDWLQHRVLPMVGNRRCCMEFVVYEKMLLSWLHDPECWERTFMLGGMNDGPYIYDIEKNGHAWADADDAYAEEKLEEMYVAPEDMIRQVGRPFMCLSLYMWSKQAHLPSKIEYYPDPHGIQNRLCLQDYDLNNRGQSRQVAGQFIPAG